MQKHMVKLVLNVPNISRFWSHNICSIYNVDMIATISSQSMLSIEKSLKGARVIT